MGNNEKTVRIFLFFTMLLSAMMLSSIASLMTTFQDLFVLTKKESSLAPVILSLGIMGGNIISGFLISGIGLKNSILTGFISGLISIAIVTTAGSFYVMAVGFLFIGFAVSFCISSITTVFAHLDIKLQNYGFLHGFFGIGAALTPFFVGYLIRIDVDYRVLLFGYAALYLIGLSILFFSDLIKNVKYEPIKLKDAAALLKEPAILYALLIFTLYAGMEQSTATWSGNLFEDLFGYSRAASSTILSGFWIVFAFGRLITQFLNNKLGYAGTLYSVLGLAVLSFIAVLLTGHFILFLVVGLVLGPVFPTVQKYINSRLSGRDVGLMNGLSYAGTGIGSMIIVRMMGAAADNSLYLSYSIPTAVSAILIVLVLLLVTRSRKVFGD